MAARQKNKSAVRKSRLHLIYHKLYILYPSSVPLTIFQVFVMGRPCTGIELFYLRKGRFFMLFWMHALYFMLRVQGSGGSFPRPLSTEEEERCLERLAQGDSSARDTLIEHNLRLVAHIVKKIRCKR